MLRTLAQDGCPVCEKHLAICTAQRTLELVCSLEGFRKKPVVTGVCTKPGLPFEVVPPIDLDLSEFTLKVYAMEGSFFLRTIRLS